MSAMKRLFQVMADKKASDIFLSVGAPINIKINGIAVPVNQTIMTSDTVQAAAVRGADRAPGARVRGRDGAEHRRRDPGRRRLPHQRLPPEGLAGRCGALYPRVDSTLDSLGLPEVLKEVIMQKRGLILMVGATGAGKSTSLAAMLGGQRCH